MDVKNKIMKTLFDHSIEYESLHCGKFRILDEFRTDKGHYCLIQFVDTGYKCTVRADQCSRRGVVDKFRPSVAGVGYIGNGHPNYFVREYSTWSGMINRCYNKNQTLYHCYGGVGVTVSDRWKCFEYFCNDIPYLDGYPLWLQYKGRYQLDKDKLQYNIPLSQRVYSKETCCFISVNENTYYNNVPNDIKDTYGYVGVSLNSRKTGYRSMVDFNGEHYFLGVYQTPDAAAIVRNWFIQFNGFDNIPLNNIVNNMALVDALNQRRSKTKFKEMCKIVERE